VELRNAGIPIEDLRKFLNSLPGPPLTPTDVTQRLKSVDEEAYNRYPDERLREICLELYNSRSPRALNYRRLSARFRNSSNWRASDCGAKRRRPIASAREKSVKLCSAGFSQVLIANGRRWTGRRPCLSGGTGAPTVCRRRSPNAGTCSASCRAGVSVTTFEDRHCVLSLPKLHF
jgi:hypothetical protein